MPRVLTYKQVVNALHYFGYTENRQKEVMLFSKMIKVKLLSYQNIVLVKS